MQNKKGFTIIELLVVIAIIAVLAAVVLVNVTQYISKGKDAAAKGNMATLLTNGAVYYDTHNDSYNGFDNATSFKSVNASLDNAGYTLVYSGSNTSWCASVVTKFATANSFCVDSSGKKAESATAVCAGQACPD